MTLDQFYKISFSDQIAAIGENGALVGKRQNSKAHMHLYQLYGFYVELAYTKSDGCLWRIGPFDHPVLLQPYLDQIDICDLIH